MRLSLWSGLIVAALFAASACGTIQQNGNGNGDGGGNNGDGGGWDPDSGTPPPCVGCSTDEIGNGTSSPWDPTDENSDGVIVDSGGALSLAGVGTETLAVWVANSAEGTVSKLDPKTGREVGRYPAAVQHPANGARPWSERCNGSSQGNCPSRTAIDFYGNAWVANRAFGNQGTVTKIGGKPEHCDQTGGADGVFKTSYDKNGDGRIDLNDPDEFPGANDDCVRFTVDVGGPNDVPRALAIAPNPNYLGSGGVVWVGLNLARKAIALDAANGAKLAEVDLPLNPYGALAAKALRVVWFTNAGWQRNLANNDPGVVAVSYMDNTVGPKHDVVSTNGECTGGTHVGTYGLTVDLVGRVWVGGFPCTAAFRYDPTTDTWMTVNVPGVGATRGIVVDKNGEVWLAHSHCPDSTQDNTCGKISRFSSEDGSGLHTYSFNAQGTIGVDMDSDGNLWGVNQNTNNVVRIEPQSGTTAMFPVGDGPYTYSDFTGHSLMLQFAPGVYRHVFQPCPAGQRASWQQVILEKDEPAGTKVEVSVRTGDTLADLQAAPWYGTWGLNPAQLTMPPGPVPDGTYLEVELELSTNGDATPRVFNMQIAYFCAGVPD
jgi:streptogramin lyase